MYRHTNKSLSPNMLFHAQKPTTTTTMLNIENQKRQQYSICQEDGKLFEITQRLNSAQYHYEFPPKSHALSCEATRRDNHLYENEDDETLSYDGYSSTSVSTETYTNYFHESTGQYQQYDHETMPPLDKAEQLLDQYLDILTFGNESESPNNKYSYDQHFIAADEELSPLQLPTQAIDNGLRSHHSFSTIDSMFTVNRKLTHYACPTTFFNEKNDGISWDASSYIFPDYINSSQQVDVYQPVHPYHCPSEETGFSSDDLLSLRGDEDEDDSDIEDIDDGKDANVVLIKISRKKLEKQFSSTHISVYNAYDELPNDSNDNRPLETGSIFIPIDNDFSPATMIHQQDVQSERQEAAAIKVQSLWRGYQCRKNLCASKQLTIPSQVLAGLARINNSIQTRNIKQLHARIDRLEGRLQEETAMRIAFENAMEDMAIQVDQQNQALEERMHQMQKEFALKTEILLSHVESMNSVVTANNEAKVSIENKLSLALLELKDLRLQMKQDAEEKKNMQQQLKRALEELDSLKAGPHRVNHKQHATTVAVRVPVTASAQAQSASATAPTRIKSKQQPLLQKTQTSTPNATRRAAAVALKLSTASRPDKSTMSRVINSKTRKSATVNTASSRTNKPTTTAATVIPKVSRAIAVS